MPLPENLNSTDLAILRSVANNPGITTREIEGIIYLSRSQILRRLEYLQSQGLVIRRNGTPGQTYYFELSPDTTTVEIERYNQTRLDINRDPLAREALEVLIQGIRAISDQLALAGWSPREHSEMSV